MFSVASSPALTVPSRLTPGVARSSPGCATPLQGSSSTKRRSDQGLARVETMACAGPGAMVSSGASSDHRSHTWRKPVAEYATHMNVGGWQRRITREVTPSSSHNTRSGEDLCR